MAVRNICASVVAAECRAPQETRQIGARIERFKPIVDDMNRAKAAGIERSKEIVRRFLSDSKRADVELDDQSARARAPTQPGP